MLVSVTCQGIGRFKLMSWRLGSATHFTSCFGELWRIWRLLARCMHHLTSIRLGATRAAQRAIGRRNYLLSVLEKFGSLCRINFASLSEAHS